MLKLCDEEIGMSDSPLPLPQGKTPNTNSPELPKYASTPPQALLQPPINHPATPTQITNLLSPFP